MVVFLIDAQPAPARVVRHLRRDRRLRLEVPGLQGDRFLGRRLEQALRTWPGVEEARADPRSGRFLLRYAHGAPLLERLREEPEALLLPLARGALEVPPSRHWHTLHVPEVLAALDTGVAGLSAKESARRLRRFGPNLLAEEEARSRLSLLTAQVANVPMGMLLGSAALSALLGDPLETAAILVVVGVNAAIGYRIERHNQELLASWQQLQAGHARVLRDGALLTVHVATLVPGDVLVCRAGDVLPADARVVEAHRLACDEAPLTGESEPQPKSAPSVAERTPLAERTSMLYAGTTVATGHGRAVVVATASRTELARVRQLAEAARAPTDPLVRRLARLDSRAAVVSVGLAMLTGAAGLLHGRPVTDVLRGTVALGVAALPEGLPLVATAALVRSMQRLHARGMVVRRVASAEALGGVTVICADKTGTVTLNEMELEVLDLGEGPLSPQQVRAQPERLFAHPPTLALAAALLNSDVDVQRSGMRLAVSGSATERALVEAAHAAGLDGAALRRTFPRRHLYERRERIQYVVSIHEDPDNARVAFLKGAPEQVLALCDRDFRGPLDASARARLRRRNEQLASEGLRVLALAWRRLPPGREASPEQGGYTWIGLVGLRDRLREGAADSIRLARSAGIRTLLLTGDQKRTAEAVARQVGLRGEARTAAELQLLRGDGTDARAELDRMAVIARVTPEDKLALVRALRARGEVVAMAGDGVNDAPALKAADVGIAVGASATDLAREVADVVMAGEDLRSIISAVGEGRIVQDNLRRALRFLFATNSSEMALMIGAALLGARDPLTPMQLLWINLLTDTLPGVALALEPGRPDVLDRPPPPPQLLSPHALRRVGLDGLLLAGVGAAGLVLGGPPLAFSMLTAAQLSYVDVCRAPYEGAREPEAQRRYLSLVGGAMGMQLGALTLPTLRHVLGLPAPSVPGLVGLAAGFLAPRLLMRRTDGRIRRRVAPSSPAPFRELRQEVSP